MKYYSFLKRIESAMELSGVRNYCANTCYGACCDGCFESEKACHKNEGRRLACSLFICATLRDILFTGRQDKVFRDLTEDVSEALRRAGGKIYDSPYFDPYTKKKIENFDCKTDNLKKFVVMMKGARIQRIMSRLSYLVKRANVSEKRVKSIERKKKKEEKGKKNLSVDTPKARPTLYHPNPKRPQFQGGIVK